MIKIGSLCTGYGGLDMAVEAYFDAEMVWCAEVDKYASELIKQRFDKPNHGDIKTIQWDQVEPIDVLTAGYPCQPFSQVGLKKGLEDERHLFPYVSQAIRVLRPKLIILENVAAHLRIGFNEVIHELTELGYDLKWSVISASEIGALHNRKRLFIIAYSDGQRLQRSSTKRYPAAELFEVNDGKLSIWERINGAAPQPIKEGRSNAQFVEWLMGLPKGWVTDLGLSWTQQLKMLGNGVVPQQAYHAIDVLVRHTESLTHA
jgi:DNA (cytosine-5)-methyltransferase 1